MEFDRIYAKIHLDRMERNMEAMEKNLAPGTKIIGTVKADGYGHGAVWTAKAIDRYVAGFAVAAPEEAVALRKSGIAKPILILGVTGDSWYRTMAEEGISMAVFQLSRARKIGEAAMAAGLTAKVQIAVDTGMSRIGLPPSLESVETVKAIEALPGIEIEGMFTHFARADEADKGAAREQLRRFCSFCDVVKKEGIKIPLCHCSNSAGIVDLPEANLDAVRAGITIYGLYPSREVDINQVPLEPAMELKSFVTFVKEIPVGTAVSYGGTYVAESPRRIATVSAGYGDGYPRNLSGKGAVLIRGKRAPILGRVCMDQLMADVTEIPEAAEGDCATLLGRDGGEEITMEELADLSGGFHYEIPCLVGKRVPRLYVRDGKAVGAMTCFESQYEEF